MRRELVLLAEMIEAAGQAQAPVDGIDVEALQADRQRRDALLWNFTVLGEAAAQLDDAVKERFPSVEWARRSRHQPLIAQPLDGDRQTLVQRLRGVAE